MTTSLLQGKPFYCREWVFAKLARCLEPGSDTRSLGGADSRCLDPHGSSPSGRACEGAVSPQRPSGTVIMGGPGCGKTALCCEIIWPTAPRDGSAGGGGNHLGSRILAYYFCQAHDVETLSVANFIACIADQIRRSPLISIGGHPSGEFEKTSGVAPDPVLCETDPDAAFAASVVDPLRAAAPPPSGDTLFILVDSLDESYLQSFSERAVGSRTIAELLAAHHRRLPGWLYLVCSARKQTKAITRLFAGFRKIGLDDQRKACVVRDVQQYILCRLDREDRLRAHLSRETAEMLNQLHIKSNACLLYLEKVLDGVVDGFIRMEEIRDMPGTLNGLYLWLCQRLFPSATFALVRPILNATFAARRPLTDVELYSCVLTRDTSLTFDDFQHRMCALSRILTRGGDGARIPFHQSFAEWLLDVKYCTQRYLCTPGEGHAMLALSFTLHAPSLSISEIHHFAFHVAKASVAGLESYHRALWVLVSGVAVWGTLECSVPREQAAVELLLRAGARLPTDEALVSSITGMSSVGGEPGEGEEGGLEGILGRDQGSVDELDSNGRTGLCNLAFQGDVARVKALLGRGPEAGGPPKLEATDSTGQTALCLAARHGHVDVVAALIAAGAAVDHADLDGWTALRSAAWGGHPDVVTQLLAARAGVDMADRDGRTALRAASWAGHADVAAILLDHGAGVNCIDQEGRTALIAAAYMGHADIVRLLLMRGADVDHADIDGRTALSVAALCVPPAPNTHAVGEAGPGRAEEVVAVLLEHGATVDVVDKDGMTPFCVAAYEGHADICELLLETGEADIDHTDCVGRSALEGAVCMGHAAVVRLLLFWGAYVDMIDGDGRTVLCSAAQQGSAEVVQLLLDRGLDETHRDNCGWSPLHIAASEGHDDVVQTLLDAGAHVLERDNDGRVAVLLGAQEGHAGVVSTLLRAGSPLETHGHDGRTPLRLAALEGHADVVRCLLGYGADVNRPDADRRTALHDLSSTGDPSIAAMLLDAGADPALSDADRRTPLHVAAWHGRAEIAALLLSRGADADARDRELSTPLMLAARRGHSDVATVLIEHGGAEVDYGGAAGGGQTALGVAVREGQEGVVRVLLAHGADALRADPQGRIPLDTALALGHTGIVEAMRVSARAGGRTGGLKSGGDRDRKKREGEAEGVAYDRGENRGAALRENRTRSADKHYGGAASGSKASNRLSGPVGGAYQGGAHQGGAGACQGGPGVYQMGPGARLASHADRLASYASVVPTPTEFGVSTSPVVTSGVSSIDTRYSCRASSARSPHQTFVTSSPPPTAVSAGATAAGGAGGMGGGACPSNHSSSKSSGIQINSLSTNRSSSSSGECAKGSRGGEGGVGGGPATQLSFTQELQQCSGPRKNRSLTRLLSPVTEPGGVSRSTGRGSRPSGGPGGTRQSTGSSQKSASGGRSSGSREGAYKRRVVPLPQLPGQSSSSPALLGAAHIATGGVDGLGSGAEQGALGGDGSAVWTKRSVQRGGRGGPVAKNPEVERMKELRASSREGGVGADRSTVVMNPGYAEPARGRRRKEPPPEAAKQGEIEGGGEGSGCRIEKPSELPVKKETPL